MGNPEPDDRRDPTRATRALFHRRATHALASLGLGLELAAILLITMARPIDTDAWLGLLTLLGFVAAFAFLGWLVLFVPTVALVEIPPRLSVPSWTAIGVAEASFFYWLLLARISTLDVTLGRLGWITAITVGAGGGALYGWLRSRHAEHALPSWGRT